MDFRSASVEVLTSLIIVSRRFTNLITAPYKTVRRISSEDDFLQIGIIFFFVFLYFQFSHLLRNFSYRPSVVFLVFVINFLLTSAFFYSFSRFFGKRISLKSLIFTFSYGLLPTLIWFIANSLFYYFLPPPRTTSLLGKTFSIIFIAFSLSVLAWKIILFYLSVRFSTKLQFYKVVFLIILYLCVFIPYSLFLYHIRLFRVPFI